MNNQYGPPLKFKAVDTRDGKEFDPDDLQYVGGFEDPEEHEYCIGFMGKLQSLHCVICQFTGLFDIAGTEIYAGDVVTVVQVKGLFLEHPGQILTVFWDGETAGFQMCGKKKGEYAPMENLKDCRRIGNVWEPAEILSQRAENTKDLK